MPELFIYISASLAKHFPCLLYQTRYGEICFACFPQSSRTPGRSVQSYKNMRVTSPLLQAARTRLVSFKMDFEYAQKSAS
jgi:hypothetical protein